MQCWCYRRNRSGHGLYEIGVEPSNELRTLSGNSPCSDDDDEDMTTTQKMLEVVDTLSRYTWDTWTWDTCACVENPVKLKSSEKVFERRQREQLQRLARE